MNEDKAELLDEEVKEVKQNNPAQEKIEIVEHVDSKYDDIKPRTEMSEMSKEEQQEIKSKVLGDDVSPAPQEEVNKESLKTPSKSGSILKELIIITAVLLVLGMIFLFFIWPNIQNSIDSCWCEVVTEDGKKVDDCCH